MNEIEQVSSSSISRRDFLKLKSFLLIWYYFLQSFGINLLSDNSHKIDYSLLDKLQNLPFSDEVMEELNLRADLQKKYSTNANGKIVPLDRFIKEITNFIISKKDFKDFKLLSSIKDEQIDYNYMFISTARHNEKKSMQYLQKRLISHKDDAILRDALEYAIKSKSFDTTLHLMQQKIKLDSKSQKYLLGVLHRDEYEVFYKNISGNKHMALPNYSQKAIIQKRKMSKKTFSFEEYYTCDASFIYDYLHITIHNSLVDLYEKNFIEDFTLNIASKKAHIITYANTYVINFIERFESALYKNGFTSWSEDLLQFSYFESDIRRENIDYIRDHINKFLYERKIDTYDFLNIEMM